MSRPNDFFFFWTLWSLKYILKMINIYWKIVFNVNKISRSWPPFSIGTFPSTDPQLVFESRFSSWKGVLVSLISGFFSARRRKWCKIVSKTDRVRGGRKNVKMAVTESNAALLGFYSKVHKNYKGSS